MAELSFEMIEKLGQIRANIKAAADAMKIPTGSFEKSCEAFRQFGLTANEAAVKMGKMFSGLGIRARIVNGEAVIFHASCRVIVWTCNICGDRRFVPGSVTVPGQDTVDIERLSNDHDEHCIANGHFCHGGAMLIGIGFEGDWHEGCEVLTAAERT